MTPPDSVAAAALALVGCRFRLHGRDPATGLDCVGVVLIAMRAGGFDGAAPQGYPLRGGDLPAICARMDAAGLVRADGVPMPGELLLCAAGPAQFHFAIGVAGGIVHADAALRRVVFRPGPPPWAIVGRWRLPTILTGQE